MHSRVSVNPAMPLVIMVLLKTVESLRNGLQLQFEVITLTSIITALTLAPNINRPLLILLSGAPTQIQRGLCSHHASEDYFLLTFRCSM